MASRIGQFQHLKAAVSHLKSSLSMMGGGGGPNLYKSVLWIRQPQFHGLRKISCSCTLEATSVVTMPSLSPTMTEGTIVKWLKNEGDTISPGDALCEIQTDKAVMTLEWDDDAIFAKILMPENSIDVKVGTAIALTVDEGDDWKSVQVPSGVSTSAAPPSSAPSPTTASKSSEAAPPPAAEVAMAAGVHRIKMPSLSPTMTEGTIVQWMKKEGDPISAGDVLCEIQTDKAVMSLECDEDGILAKILMPDGSADVKVGSIIALVVDEGEDWKNVQVPSATATSAPPIATSKAKKVETAISQSSSESGLVATVERLIGPAVHHYLRKFGLISSQLKGSGPHGVISKGDVLSYVKTNNLKPVSQDAGVISSPGSVASKGGPPKEAKPVAKKGKIGAPASFVDVEVSNMRRVIAKRLLQSKSTIPHTYGTAECNVHNMTAFRKKLAAEGIKVSVNDIIIKCVGNALIRVPAINCVWEQDKLSQKSLVDISVAVATPNGLITPIVFNVGSKDVIHIGDTVKVLAAKAKDGKLQPQEFIGGTFSVSNLGMFGIHSFSAIINPPQCAILAVGGNSISIDDKGKPLTTTKITLSFDATAIPNDEASKFLAILKNEIETTNEISMGIYDVRARKERIDFEA